MKNDLRHCQQYGSAIKDVGRRYDRMIEQPLHQEYFQQSDFLNYGYWEETTCNQREASENLIEKLLGWIPEKHGFILDVACGKGASSRYLTKYYPADRITGINISEKQLEIARENVPGCNFFVMDATCLDFQDETFDNIICVEAAFHFNTRRHFFSEAYRVLKPGGWLVLSDILMHVEAERKRMYRHEENYVQDENQYQQILESCGFHNVQLIDATRECWKGHFFGVVKFFHEKFLSGEITREDLDRYLRLTYDRVSDTKKYILAAARKIKTSDSCSDR